MKILTLILIVFSLISCSSTDDLFNQNSSRTAIALQQRSVWAEVLEYRYRDSRTDKYYKKQIIIFKYPHEGPYIRSYNRDGSFRMLDFYGDKRINYPLELAQQSEKARNNYYHLVQFAKFIKNEDPNSLTHPPDQLLTNPKE